MPENTLAATATELLKGIEAIYPEMVCSILELDPSSNKVYHLAGPSLDKEYIKLINGSEIGPENGSCGSAAYYKKQVIVRDIENDALWKNYRSFSKPFNLKACWSTPVMSSDGIDVLATFAIYYKSTRDPKQEELQIIERTTNIIRLLIESRRNHEHVRLQNNRLKDIASLSSHELRRPVATILGLANLFDEENPGNPVNKEVIDHMGATAKELDKVIHLIVDKTVFEDGK
jgi:GAF domain-containing protein